MPYSDARKFFSNIALGPYTLKDLRLLVARARQDFINSGLDLWELYAKQREASSGIISWWLINLKIRKKIKDIGEKRKIVDNLERALEISENNSMEEIEKRGAEEYILEERESKDHDRFEERIESVFTEINKEFEYSSKSLNDQEKTHQIIRILSVLAKQTTELRYILEKQIVQNNRRRDWETSGPTQSEMEKYFKE